MNHRRDGWPQYYILVGRTPFATEMKTWARSSAAVVEARKACAQIDAIAKNAGAKA
jgi:hypothetical protein